MLTRRTLLRTGLAASLGTAVAGPSGLSSLPMLPAAATPALPVDLVARRRGPRTYAVVTGRDSSGAWFFLAADGRTRVPLPSVRRTMTPLAVDVAVALPTDGTARRVNLPPLSSGRVYFSTGGKLAFFVNPGRGLVLPSVANPQDPNIATDWTFLELTYAGGLYANLSFVDFVGMPIGMRLATAGATQTVGGLRRDGLARIAAGLRSQTARGGSGWNRLVVSRGGAVLRVLSPNQAAAAAGGRSPVDGYLDSYLSQTWQRYRSTDLVLDTQSAWGVVRGRVGADGRLTFRGVGSFARPSTYATFTCSVAPFTTGNDLMGNISARLAAALNRTTLLANPRQPDLSPARFYTAARTNHYARLVHACTAGGQGYAFPYDDVHGPGYNAEGRVVDAKPLLLRVEVG